MLAEQLADRVAGAYVVENRQQANRLETGTECRRSYWQATMTNSIERYGTLLALVLLAFPASSREERTSGQETARPEFGRVKIAAVQVNGYDKKDVPRDKYDAADVLLPYIRRAGLCLWN